VTSSHGQHELDGEWKYHNVVREEANEAWYVDVFTWKYHSTKKF
jgi:hypothetical protein